MAAPRILIPHITSSLPECTPNLMPFHIDYTGPANVSRFMKVDKMKLEEVTVTEEPLKDGEAPSASSGGDVGVDGVEVTRDTIADAPAVPMDTDASTAAPESEAARALKRTATDVEMDDLTASITTTTTAAAAVASAVPNADTDTEMLPSTTATSTSTVLSISRTESTIIESQSTLASSSSYSLSPNPTTATTTCTTLLEDAEKRFVSTFRGRTIHGLTIDLPPGYGGLVLRREGDDFMNSAFDVGDVTPAAADTKGKGRANPNGKDRSTTKGKGNGKEGEKSDNKKPLPRRGRLTRSAAISKPEVIVVEEEPAQDERRGDDPDDGMADDTLNGDDDDIVDGALPDDDQRPVRRLIPHAQFSSFTLWHQDRPVDKGRDEYCRALTEWIALAHEIHRTDL